MSIQKKSFGCLPDGREADLYILTNKSGASVEITNYGGIISALNLPDKDGVISNVLLGYSDVSGYVPTCGYLGALIGRVGNRIAKGECTVSGQKLQLAKNDNGLNHLHGGNVGYNERFWDVTPMEGICKDMLILKLFSPDGEEGYPGNLQIMVTYTFTDLNELIIEYEALSDKDTLCNLTNHAYFNLEGEGSGSVEDHRFYIHADSFTVSDKELIPTGEMRPVEGTNFDFRMPVRLGDVLEKTQEDEQLRNGGGVDHNFNLVPDEDGLALAATVTAPVSGRIMNVYTDMPAVQFYSGNMLESIHPGRCGRQYHKHEGFCLETQFAPDSINQPSFPDSVLYAGEKYDYITIFEFQTVKMD